MFLTTVLFCILVFHSAFHQLVELQIFYWSVLMSVWLQLIFSLVSFQLSPCRFWCCGPICKCHGMWHGVSWCYLGVARWLGFLICPWSWVWFISVVVHFWIVSLTLSCFCSDRVCLLVYSLPAPWSFCWADLGGWILVFSWSRLNHCLQRWLSLVEGTCWTELGCEYDHEIYGGNWEWKLYQTHSWGCSLGRLR